MFLSIIFAVANVESSISLLRTARITSIYSVIVSDVKGRLTDGHDESDESTAGVKLQGPALRRSALLPYVPVL